MSDKEYHTLRRYAIKFANDPDDQNDLVLLARQESNRLGVCVNSIACELHGRDNKQSIVGAKAGGKSKRA